MRVREAIVVVLGAMVALSALYAPQPLLPVFVAEFGVSREDAALLTTATLVPLFLAPIVYGYVLERLSSRTLLFVSVLCLGIMEIPFALATSFPMLLFIRFIHGLFIPAMLTALMTFISTVTTGVAMRRMFGLYIAATILGGFLGRAMSGTIASVTNWRVSFFVLAATIIAVAFSMLLLRKGQEVNVARLTPSMLFDTIRKPVYLASFLMMMLVFFVFVSILNFLPYRIVELGGEVSPFVVGMMYTGFLMGIVSSLSAARVSVMIGSVPKSMLFGLGSYVVSVVLFAVPSIVSIFAVMFLFSGAMFFLHTLTSSFVNGLAETNRGVVNGLYVALYYLGGAIGSIAPGFIYREFGWNVFIAALVAALVLASTAAGFLHVRST